MKEETALEAFRSGLNCAQSVVKSYAESSGADENALLGISTGFGGGMARLQHTCGAVTGAFMVLGMVNSGRYTDRKEIKDTTYAMIREFNTKFLASHGSTDCRTLLGCDLNTEEGQAYMKQFKLSETICEKCVVTAVSILNEQLAR